MYVGIPILKIVFGDSPNLSAFTLPLLVYHPTQILLGGCLVPFLQDWIKKGGEETSRTPTPTTSTSEQLVLTVK